VPGSTLSEPIRQQTRYLIEDDPETAEKMFEEYALKDAGDRCRLPDLPRIAR
jgi:hypothetical protein